MKGNTWAGIRATLAVVTISLTFVIPSRGATITWVNPASGTWNNATNWDPNQVPGANDIAFITNNSVTVTLDVSPSVHGIILGANGDCGASGPILALNGQTLTLDGPLVVNACGQLSVDSGTL